MVWVGAACSAAPTIALVSELHGGGLRFTPRVRRRSAEVDCKPGPVPHAGCPTRGSDHSSRRRIAAPLEHSTRALAPLCDASGGPPSSVPLFELAPGGACSAAGHPAVARGLLPHDFNLACASLPLASQRSADQRPSAVWFLLRFPSSFPGSPLTTSLPCGARTFLPRARGPAGDRPSTSGSIHATGFVRAGPIYEPPLEPAVVDLRGV